jgi:hypothetical protein
LKGFQVVLVSLFFAGNRRPYRDEWIAGNRSRPGLTQQLDREYYNPPTLTDDTGRFELMPAEAPEGSSKTIKRAEDETVEGVTLIASSGDDRR